MRDLVNTGISTQLCSWVVCNDHSGASAWPSWGPHTFPWWSFRMGLPGEALDASKDFEGPWFLRDALSSTMCQEGPPRTGAHVLAEGDGCSLGSEV